jgi:hypothetical protein
MAGRVQGSIINYHFSTERVDSSDTQRTLFTKSSLLSSKLPSEDLKISLDYLLRFISIFCYPLGRVYGLIVFSLLIIDLNSSSPGETLIMSHCRYYTSTHFGVSYYQIRFITLSRMKLFCFPSPSTSNGAEESEPEQHESEAKQSKTRYILPIKTETLCRIPNIYLIHYLYFCEGGSESEKYFHPEYRRG